MHSPRLAAGVVAVTPQDHLERDPCQAADVLCKLDLESGDVDDALQLRLLLQRGVLGERVDDRLVLDRLGTHHRLCDGVTGVCVRLDLAWQVRVRQDSEPLLWRPALRVQDGIPLREVVHVLARAVAANHLCLGVVGIGVRLPDQRGPDVPVVDEQVRERGGHRAVQQRVPRDAVCRRHVLVYLHFILEHVAVLREADAVPEKVFCNVHFQARCTFHRVKTMKHVKLMLYLKKCFAMFIFKHVARFPE